MCCFLLYWFFELGSALHTYYAIYVLSGSHNVACSSFSNLLSFHAAAVPLATEGWDAAIPPPQIPTAGIEGAAPATGWD